MRILGIETTCDETAVAIVEDGKKILCNLVASQAEHHERFGGVFPEVASRRHQEVLLSLVKEATQDSDVDAIAVAHGPGLIGAILTGLTAAKSLALAWNKPLIAVNHVEAHLYAAMMDHPPIFPALGVVLSGGHTFTIRIDDIGSYTLIGTTVDDAIGEAFDKVASMLGLPYPGGPHIENLALQGDPDRYPFKAGRVKEKPLHFSFSGLKTNVLYTVKGERAKRDSPTLISEEEKAHVAASFQRAAFDDVIEKSLLAAATFSPRAIYLGGGVTNSQTLREKFAQATTLPLYFPPRELSLDNAAMIAALAYHKSPSPLTIEPQTRIDLALRK